LILARDDWEVYPPTKRDTLEIDDDLDRGREIGVEALVQAVKAGVGGKVDQPDSGVPGYIVELVIDREKDR